MRPSLPPLSLLFLSLSLHASMDLQKAPAKLGPTSEMAAVARQHNARRLQNLENIPFSFWTNGFLPDRPFADYEDVGYLIISSEDRFSSLTAKKELIKNLPNDVTAIILIEPGSTADAQRTFAGVLPEERMKFLEVSDFQNAFWARDSVPIPVWLESGKSVGLTGAKYYHGGGSNNQLISGLFNTQLNEIDFYNEGGNLEADSDGNCLIVHNDRSDLVPDSIYITAYGCKTINRLPHLTGIGHVDEVVRLLPNHIALTDQPMYQKTLEDLGYQVSLLPMSDVDFGTYANSLVINGAVFLPTYNNEILDAQAISSYQMKGLKVIPLPSIELSSEGNGSIHCITMTYPKVPLKQLLQYLQEILN